METKVSKKSKYGGLEAKDLKKIASVGDGHQSIEFFFEVCAGKAGGVKRTQIPKYGRVWGKRAVATKVGKKMQVSAAIAQIDLGA